MGARTAKFSEVDFRRHELRDGSGPMWPERNAGEHFKIGQTAAEVAVALSRRRRRVVSTARPRKFEQKLGGNRSRKYG